MKIDNLNMETEGEEQAVVKPRVTNSILDGFGLLKEQEVDKKVTGGFKILLQVNGDNEEKVKDRDYVLKRLVRSLGANVPEVRSGYFATLVALLCKHEAITITQVLELVKKELHANGSSKSEVGDVALGQILVCGAVFRSGRMLLCTEEQQQQVIQLFLNASRKKSYLSTVAYLLLLDFVTKLDAEQFSSIIWSKIKDEFKKEIKEHSLDSLYFLMVVANKFPEKVKLRKLIGVSEVLCEDNIPDICEKIMSGIDFNTVGHPIYTEIAGQIANSPNLKTFWLGIDNQLVKHNRNRELVSLNMLTTILSNFKENYEIIPDLLSKNSFKLFMDWFKGLQTASKVRNKRDDEDDRKIMLKKEKELLKVLSETLKSDKVDNSVRVAVLKKLLFNPGEINFTEITGTTIVKSIIADLDEHSVKKFAKSFKGVLLNTTKKQVKEGVERSWYNNERVKAAELISYLVNQEAVKDDTEFKLTYMKLLMCFGFFKVGGEENISINKDLAVRIKLCFYRCFTSRFSNVDNLVTVLSSLSTFICNMLENEDVRLKLEKQFDKENMECWQVVIDICKPIEANKSKSKIDKVFLILLYQLGLFLFSEPDHVKIARESIKELKSCHEHVKKDKKKSKKKGGDLSQDEEPEWVEVLVEVLLSILSVESSVLRSVVQCVFKLLWEHLTPSAVGQIVSVLDPESESDPLTQDSDSEDENGVDGNDDSNEEDEIDKEEEEESDDTDVASDEDDDDENDMKTPDQLRMAVQKALGANATESDAESIDADMITEEDGNKLDSALAEAFKQFHQGKGKQRKKERKDKKTLSDFRIRVLDLVDIYLEKDPSMDVCLAMIAPLTRCLEFCIQDNQLIELEKRVRKTIKNLTAIRKFNSTEDTTFEILSDYLSAALDKGSRSQYSFRAIGNVVTQFATFVIHCSQKILPKNGTSPKKNKSSDLVKVVKEATQNYFTNRKCQLPIILFHNILRLDWEGNYKVASVIIENILNNEVRQFRRNEGLDLLSTFFQSLKRNRPTGKAVTSLSKLEQQLGDSIMKALSGDTEVAMPTKFLNGLSNVINVVKSLHTILNTTPALDAQSLHAKIITAKAADKNNKKSLQKENNAKKLQQNKPLANLNNEQENGIQTKGKKQKNRKRKEGVMNGHVQPQQKKKRTNSVAN